MDFIAPRLRHRVQLGPKPIIFTKSSVRSQYKGGKVPTSITIKLRVKNIAMPHVIIAVNIILWDSEKDNKAGYRCL